MPNGSTEELHLVALSMDGTIWHAIRHSDGSWTPLENLDQLVGNPGAVYAAATAEVAGELHLTALTVAGFPSIGTIWHAIRHSDGSWSPFGNVNYVVGDPSEDVEGLFTGFVAGPADIFGEAAHAVTGIGGELHLAAVSTRNDFFFSFPGSLMWHAIRYPDGTWSPLGDVTAVVGHPGTFQQAATAGVAGELHLAGLAVNLVGPSGVIWHAIRHGDGSWTPFRTAPHILRLFREGSRVPWSGPYSQVALAGVSEELHLAGLDETLIIWHSIRHADGSWTTPESVNDVVGQPPDADVGHGVAVAEVAGELHLIGQAWSGTIWHTIRHPDGSWEPFDNVNDAVGMSGQLFGAALAGVAQ